MRVRLLPENPSLGWTPYAWLGYLPFSLLFPWLSHAPRLTWIVAWLGILLFLPVYFWGYWLKGRRTLFAVAGITAIGMLSAKINPGAAFFFVYAAGFIGEIGEAGECFAYLAGLLALIVAESWLLRLDPQFWIPALGVTVIVGAVDIYFSAQRRVNRKLQMAREDVAHIAKVAERERIARDLHDLLGHTLSVIVLKSELASKLAEKDPARAASEIRDVESISREALAQVRAAVRGYRSAGLENELDQARNTLAAANIQVTAEMEPFSAPPAQESVLALALREAVTNIVRHSRATNCQLRVLKVGPFYELQVSDNGRGGDSPEGFGLSGMRRRVESLGGSIERNGRGGTTLRIRLPRRAPEYGGV